MQEDLDAPAETEGGQDHQADVKENNNVVQKVELAGAGNVTHKKITEDLTTDRVNSGRSAAPSPSKPPKSSGSGDVTYESRPRQRKKKPLPPGAHQVNFTTTIAMAIPTVQEDDSNEEAHVGGRRRKRVVEQPRAQNYFHFEYQLTPNCDGGGEGIKTDIVTYGVAARIYTERQDSKPLRTWQDGNHTWIAWTHCHSVIVTDNLLKKLHCHTMNVRVWDTKDKVSAKVRFDRPKAIRLPTAKSGEHDGLGGVRGQVFKLANSYEQQQPKPWYITRPLPFQRGDSPCSVDQDAESRLPRPDTEKTSHRSRNERQSSKAKSVAPDMDVMKEPQTGANKKGEPDREDLSGKLVRVSVAGHNSDMRSYSRLGRLAGLSTPQEPTDPNKKQAHKQRKGGAGSEALNEHHPQGKLKPIGRFPNRGHSRLLPPMEFDSHLTTLAEIKTAEGSDSGMSGRTSARAESTRPRGHKKMDAAAIAAAEHAKQYGASCIPVRLAKVFAGMKTVTERMEKPIPTIDDLFVMVSVEGDLMSEQQKERLNPMVIRISTASNMPDRPMSFKEMKTKCQPAYVKYQLYKQPEHCSIGREHGPSIHWDDISVILAGTLEHSELREYLNGPPLEIQVHDRDRIPEKQKLQPTLFGDDLEDEKISNVGTVASRRTIYNPFSGRDKPWDPFGISKFDLSGLLLGQQMVELKAPIQPCPVPDVLGLRDGRQDGKLIGIAGAVDGPTEVPLPAGSYMEYHSTLKIRVEVARPLVTVAQLAMKEDLQTTAQCPFSRILYKFAYKNVSMLQKLQSLLQQINASALELQDMPPEVVETALSTYKLSLEQQQSSTLDIVTGFQLLDGTQHLFLLEGLRDGAIEMLWNALPKPENSDVEILFNSDLCFHQRLYGPLDVDLTRIKLHEPLGLIVQQPLLYVRDMVPKPCFQSLVKLHEMTKVSKLKDAVKSDLFPSAEMVISMSREFGVPLTAQDFEELQPEVATMQRETSDMYDLPHTSRIWTPIDNTNPIYDEKIKDRKESAINKDFMTMNKEEVLNKSQNNYFQRSNTMPEMIRIENESGHNYSTQTLNSTEKAKEKLRQTLKKDPDRRYTYCLDYHHSMTILPGNPEQERRHTAKESRGSWRTATGFIYPGKKTMIESNKHQMKPDHARRDELETPWTENSLHAKHRPTLNRERFAWPHRNYDMDVWTRPPTLFGNDEPITIHLAGQKLREERKQTATKEQHIWQQKLIVADPRLYGHRCNPQTELKEKGIHSNNQLDRLKGLLKDQANKVSLSRPGFNLKEIPPLSVVLNPSVDTATRALGLPIPVDPEPPKSKGFVPGPYKELSWCAENNMIPVRDYEHKKFMQEKGKDFNVYHKTHSGVYKRTVIPLADEEYENNLFPWPKNSIHCQYLAPNMEEFNKLKTAQDLIDAGSTLPEVSQQKMLGTVS